MLYEILAILTGLLLLTWGADRFVAGAAATARNLGVSPMVVGLTVVGFGTSAPEMLVSAVAAWQGNPNLGVGNALGSNITNVGLVLGLTALVTPLTVRSETLSREFPILLAIMLVALTLTADGHLSRLDGLILVLGMAIMAYWMAGLGLDERAAGRAADPMPQEWETEIPELSTGRALFWLLAGLVILLLSSRLLVWGAVGVAERFGVSDLVIGLTIVAVGTSLPELAASLMSALRRQHDIAVGNVLGSNMFNLLGVLGLPGIIHPTALPPELLQRDFPLMVALTIALFAMACGFRHPGRITRAKGLVLLGVWCGYNLLLWQQARGVG